MAATASPPNPAVTELAEPVIVAVGRMIDEAVDGTTVAEVEVGTTAEQAPADWNPTVIHWLQKPIN